MVTRTEDQLATVLALRPPRRNLATGGSARVTAIRRPASKPANVIQLPRARRRASAHDYGPQGGDAA